MISLKASFVRDDYSGQLDFDLSVKVYKWSQNNAIHEFKSKVKTDSFSSKIVFSQSIPDLLKQSNCLDKSECVLNFQISDSGHKLQVNYI